MDNSRKASVSANHESFTSLKKLLNEQNSFSICSLSSVFVAMPIKPHNCMLLRVFHSPSANIALVHHSVPVMGVIYVPVKKELYFGVHDSGAYKLSGITARDGMSWDELLVKAVRLPETSVHERFVIVASRSHLTPETEDYIEKMKCSHAEVELISSGSSIKICLVAECKADVYPRFAPTMEWDTAAGHAIARAAGMEIYQAGKEEPLQYNKEDLLNPWFIVEPKHTEIK